MSPASPSARWRSPRALPARHDGPRRARVRDDALGRHPAWKRAARRGCAADDWRAIAAEAWGADILQDRSFVWLVGSRWFVLMGMNMLVNFALFYFVPSSASPKDTDLPMLSVLAATVIGNVVAVVPAARASDRLGRKPIIYAACAVGSLGLRDDRRALARRAGHGHRRPRPRRRVRHVPRG